LIYRRSEPGEQISLLVVCRPSVKAETKEVEVDVGMFLSTPSIFAANLARLSRLV
jgi:hypothetical protein